MGGGGAKEDGDPLIFFTLRTPTLFFFNRTVGWHELMPEIFFMKTISSRRVSSVKGYRVFIDSKNNSKIPDSKPLLDAIYTLAISSSEFEREQSCMDNNIVTAKRNALLTTNISSLLYIYIYTVLVIQ